MTNPILISKTYSQFVTHWLEAQPSWELWLNEHIHQPITSLKIQEIYAQEFIDKNWLELDEATFLAKLRTYSTKIDVVAGCSRH
jgi:hypothetical protein